MKEEKLLTLSKRVLTFALIVEKDSCFSPRHATAAVDSQPSATEK
jgi:hypothetical protein